MDIFKTAERQNECWRNRKKYLVFQPRCCAALKSTILLFFCGAQGPTSYIIISTPTAGGEGERDEERERERDKETEIETVTAIETQTDSEFSPLSMYRCFKDICPCFLYQIQKKTT